MAIAVTDVFSNPQPHIDRALRTLGNSNNKWNIFLAVYHGKKKQKTVQDLMHSTGLTHKQVLMAGRQLAQARLIHQEDGSPVIYSKIDEIMHIRDPIRRARGKSRQPAPRTVAKSGLKKPAGRQMRATSSKFEHDVFISHASEDKDTFVRGLANRILDEGISVWYDEFSLVWGDKLRASIDRGLRTSRFGIVVLSPAFFQKDWPQDELEGLFALEGRDGPKILPIWHDLTKEDLAEFSPMLVGRLGVSSAEPIDQIISKLNRRLKK